MRSLYTLAIIFILCWSCSTSQKSVSDNNQGNQLISQDGVSGIQNVDNTQTWASHLRRLPGVMVSGQGRNLTVRIRSQNNSFKMDNSPLFVLDDIALGSDFSSVASSINLNDVESITVLKNANETSSWGLRGSNGVIVIKSKRGGNKN